MNIADKLQALPTSGITVTALETLDFIVPGEWENITDFDEMIRQTTGETAPGVVAAIRHKALELEQADGQRVRQALAVFELVDTLDQVAAGAALAGKVTDLFGGLDFLKSFTPKPETTQAIDAGLKLVAELLSFGLLRGVPDASFDGIARFVIALQDYARADLMRVAAWIIIDGMLPLGPDFMRKITNTLGGLADNHLSDNAIFKQIGGALPGESVQEKKAFIVKALDASSEWVGKFIEEKGITPDVVQNRILSAINIADGGGDYLAAALDASTEYFSHTGVQTVARVMVHKAYEAVREDAWKAYVASLS